MSKLKLWKPFSLFMVLLLMSSLWMVVPVQANVSGITVNPYDTSIIGVNTGYRITMTAGASLNAGNTITIVFPNDTTVPDFSGSPGDVFVRGTACNTVSISVPDRQVTVTIPAIASIAPGQQFTVTFNKDCLILNPTASGSYTVTAWTSKEPIHVTSSAYAITAIKNGSSEYGTINDAIGDASDGDTIAVPSGIYAENVVIDRGLTLNGAVGAIIAPDTGPGIEIDVSPELAPVTVHGFTITPKDSALDSAQGIVIGSVGTPVATHDITISNNTITTLGQNMGILVRGVGTNGADYPNCSDLTVTGNNITLSGDSTAFYASWVTPAHSNWTITGNTFDSPIGVNLQLHDVDGVIVDNNIFKMAGSGGSTSVFFVAELCNLTSPVVFSNNDVQGSGASLVSFRTNMNTPGPSTIDDVTVTGNTFDNWVAAVDRQALGIYPRVTGVAVHQNSFLGTSTEMGLRNTSAVQVDAKYNYWGHASGPSHDSLSYGASVSAGVDFSPWLVSAYSGVPPASEIQITTTSPLPDGTTGVTYSETFNASGGSGPLVWAYYSAPGTRPAGLSFTGNNLSGIPSQPNIVPPGFSFDVQVNDGTQANYKNFTMLVYIGPPIVTTTLLPGGNINVPYGPVTLQARGGDGSYVWSMNTGSLPDGLTLAADGEISGTPTAGGTFNFNVRVVSGGQSGYQDLSITVSAPPSGPKLIGTDTSDIGTIGSNYIILSKFTAAADGNVGLIKVYGTASGNVKVAIYSDNSSEPGTLLNANNSNNPVTAGQWNTISITDTPVTSGTAYWLGAILDTNNAVTKVVSPNPCRFKAQAYAGFNWPASLTALSTSDTIYLCISGWAAGSSADPPGVTNDDGASDVAATSARLNGVITDTGDEDPSVIVYWGDDDGGTDPYAWDHSVNLGTMGAVTFYTDITDLTAGIEYWYTCFAANSGGSAWAVSSNNFTTLPLSAPTVTNSSGATNVTATSARLNGVITDTGGQDPSVIVYWGDNDGRNYSSSWDNSVNLGTKGAGPFYTDITDLNVSTKYYYRCWANNTPGNTWAASSENFTTSSGGVAEKLIGASTSGTGTIGSNYIVLSKFTASTTGAISQIKVYGSASGNVKVAVYADNSGEPGALLNSNSSSNPVTADQWSTISITSTPVTSGTAYWLAAIMDTTNAVTKVVSPNPCRIRAQTYADFSWPASLTGLSAADTIYICIEGWAIVDTAPPSAPVIITPKTTVTFEWNPTIGATKYRLQVNTASDFTGTSIFDAEVTTTSQAVTLSVGNTYYWRVRAGNSGGWSGWSATGSIAP